MKQTSYRFEKYISADCPVYSSAPEKKKNLILGHYHRDAEINKVTQGSVRFCVGTKNHLLHTGDIIFFAPYAMHEATSETEDAAIRGFIFDTAILDGDVDFDYTSDSYFLITAKHPQHAEADRLFQEMRKTYAEQPKAFRLRTKANLILFASILLENNFLLPKTDDKMRTAPVLRYIKDNYGRELSISELAALLNVCNDTLIRTFKAENGQTPFSYILNYRICEAMKLLSEKKYSISEIANQTGFSSTSYFIKSFKNKLGTSPLKYQREHFI